MIERIVRKPLMPGHGRLIYGVDAMEGLRLLPDNSVHNIITSPPYFGLRNYRVEGQIGNEPTLPEYITRMVAVFHEARRVLRPDGVLWLNLGDTYVRDNRVRVNNTEHTTRGWKVDGAMKNAPVSQPGGLPPKNIYGVPWKVAFALQDDGWILRAACPWVKRNAMPESVRSRPSSAVEYIFMLVKEPRYFYDCDAVRIASAYAFRAKNSPKTRASQPAASERNAHDSSGGVGYHPDGRARRNSDWFFESLSLALDGKNVLVVDEEAEPLAFAVNLQSYPGAHFAVFPTALVAPMLLASTSERGCCASCGAPHVRITGHPCEQCGEFVRTYAMSCEACGHVRDWKEGRELHPEFGEDDWETSGRGVPRLPGGFTSGTVPNGWEPSCKCPEAPPVPCTVLDPFSGSATTGDVALGLGRSYIGLDLNTDYLNLAEARLTNLPPPDITPIEPTDDAAEPSVVSELFGG